MRCCVVFFMGNSLSLPENLLIPFVINNQPKMRHAKFFEISIELVRHEERLKD
jgi:hypothetical protein